MDAYNERLLIAHNNLNNSQLSWQCILEDEKMNNIKLREDMYNNYNIEIQQLKKDITDLFHSLEYAKADYKYQKKHLLLF